MATETGHDDEAGRGDDEDGSRQGAEGTSRGAARGKRARDDADSRGGALGTAEEYSHSEPYEAGSGSDSEGGGGTRALGDSEWEA